MRVKKIEKNIGCGGKSQRRSQMAMAGSGGGRLKVDVPAGLVVVGRRVSVGAKVVEVGRVGRVLYLQVASIESNQSDRIGSIESNQRTLGR